MTGAAGAGTPRFGRLVCVSLNAAIDRTVAVERVVPGAIHRPRLLAAVPGGKAVNVARAAVTLGLPATAVAVLGGHAGAWYRAALEGRGVGLEAVEVGGETRTCLSVLDESTGRLTEFYESGVTLREEDWPRVEEALRRAVAGEHGVAAGRAPFGDGGALVVLAGSLPPGAPTDAYARLTRVARELGAPAAVDIDGAPLAAALRASPWLVKVNAREAGADEGDGTGGAGGPGGDGRAAATAAARRLLEAGASVAIVTRGAEGAIAVDAAGAWSVGPLPDDALGPYSVGSGDAFLAGLAAAFAAGVSLGDALAPAAAAGAANARVPGQGELDARWAGSLASRLEVRRLA